MELRVGVFSKVHIASVQSLGTGDWGTAPWKRTKKASEVDGWCEAQGFADLRASLAW
jgi:hypothetical protein